MTNPNTQPTPTQGAQDAASSPAQPVPTALHSAETHRATLNTPVSPAQTPTSHGNAPHLNTPLAGSLNARPPLFYIRATASQLKAIIQSAPEEVRSRIRANASKETMLDEVFKMRQQEAIAAAEQPQETINPQEAVHKLLTMDAGDVSVAVDTNPDNFRSLMEAALRADSSLTPRIVPEDRHSIIYTVLTWQINAHRAANSSGAAPATTQASQPVQLPDPQPPRPTANENQGGLNAQATPEPGRQNPFPIVHAGPSLNDILDAAPNPAGQSGPSNQAHPQDPGDSDEDQDARRKRAREANPMESWVQGFHTGADAALEQTLSTYPENIPGANRLNVSAFRGPKILGKVISRGMGLQQHVATFPFWRRSASGRPSQPQMEAHNLARMMQLEILAHNSPLEALRHRPSLEVGLRRLYAIMYVEKQMATGEMLDRGSAWQNIDFLLESTPSDISTCDDIEEEMTRRLTQSKRRIAATKAIKESDSRRNKRGPHNKGQAANQDGIKRRNHGADPDNKQ